MVIELRNLLVQSQKDADERMTKFEDGMTKLESVMKQSHKDADERMTKFEDRMATTISESVSESVVKALAESKNDKDGIQLILIFHDLSFTNVNTNTNTNININTKF